MDMYQLAHQVDNELFEERAKFVKSILKEKCLEMELLSKKIDALTDRLEAAEEDYEKLLTMTVDDVYDKYTSTAQGNIRWYCQICYGFLKKKFQI